MPTAKLRSCFSWTAIAALAAIFGFVGTFFSQLVNDRLQMGVANSRNQVEIKALHEDIARMEKIELRDLRSTVAEAQAEHHNLVSSAQFTTAVQDIRTDIRQLHDQLLQHERETRQSSVSKANANLLAPASSLSKPVRRPSPSVPVGQDDVSRVYALLPSGRNERKLPVRPLPGS